MTQKKWSSERERDKARKREAASNSKDVDIPACVNLRRRNRLEKNDAKWLRYYFGPDCGCTDTFWYEFTEQQIEMIRVIANAITYGGDQSMAASRGEGKTTLAERVLLKYTLQGVVKFSVLFAASGSMADNSLDAIKTAIETNDRLLEDYPEVCVPVRALENTPNRAHYQTVSGKQHNDKRKSFSKVPSKFKWSGQEIVFPSVPGAPCAGAIIATRGLDAAVRGLKRKGYRPQVALIDDPDTEETANSEEQAGKLEGRIDKGIGGLGGQQQPIARVMLTTLQNRTCVSFKFTDPKEKPSWKGKRYRFLVKPPTRMDLWDEYILQASADMQSDDDHARRAHAFYLAHRAEMDEGAVVSNPNRFNGSKLLDGTQVEVSALQRYYNEVVRIGPDAVATEYDNDPPEISGPVESSITPRRVQSQLSGYPRRIVPPGCTVVVQGMDVGKTAIHWVVRAWRPDCIGYVIDYGVQDVHGTVVGSDEGLDVAIRRAIISRWEYMLANPFTTAEGDTVPVDLTLVDAGYRTDAVYLACRDIGIGIMPAMGFGRSGGCVQANFHDVRKRSKDRKPGDGWFLSKKNKKTWLVAMDADRWKAWEHDRWMTTITMPGSITNFGSPGIIGGRLGDDEKVHHAYSQHICAEKEVEEIVKNQLKRYWKSKGRNHYLDASYMSNVAANMRGIKLLNSDGPTMTFQPGVVVPRQELKKVIASRPALGSMGTR